MGLMGGLHNEILFALDVSKEEQLLYEGFRASLEKIVNFALFFPPNWSHHDKKDSLQVTAQMPAEK